LYLKKKPFFPGLKSAHLVLYKGTSLSIQERSLLVPGRSFSIPGRSLFVPGRSFFARRHSPANGEHPPVVLDYPRIQWLSMLSGRYKSRNDSLLRKSGVLALFLSSRAT
jgi:hypothetical protein